MNVIRINAWLILLVAAFMCFSWMSLGDAANTGVKNPPKPQRSSKLQSYHKSLRTHLDTMKKAHITNGKVNLSNNLPQKSNYEKNSLSAGSSKPTSLSLGSTVKSGDTVQTGVSHAPNIVSGRGKIPSTTMNQQTVSDNTKGNVSSAIVSGHGKISAAMGNPETLSGSTQTSTGRTPLIVDRSKKTNQSTSPGDKLLGNVPQPGTIVQTGKIGADKAQLQQAFKDEIAPGGQKGTGSQLQAAAKTLPLSQPATAKASSGGAQSSPSANPGNVLGTLVPANGASPPADAGISFMTPLAGKDSLGRMVFKGTTGQDWAVDKNGGWQCINCGSSSTTKPSLAATPGTSLQGMIDRNNQTPLPTQPPGYQVAGQPGTGVNRGSSVRTGTGESVHPLDRLIRIIGPYDDPGLRGVIQAVKDAAREPNKAGDNGVQSLTPQQATPLTSSTNSSDPNTNIPNAGTTMNVTSPDANANADSGARMPVGGPPGGLWYPPEDGQGNSPNAGPSTPGAATANVTSPEQQTNSSPGTGSTTSTPQPSNGYMSYHGLPPGWTALAGTDSSGNKRVTSVMDSHGNSFPVPEGETAAQVISANSGSTPSTGSSPASPPSPPSAPPGTTYKQGVQSVTEEDFNNK